ncbi:hypothetical protein BDV96DRAFT_494463 [Lophiotrema nucula]|uniref:Rad51-like C-terminal domain-containing protein n=1 Tax=Lophiotrema nucula TaxID=690887 RepID=A0A6A5Z7T6_9PLEO|nr:hypothetical protein BDV96DRAFT_494463 [Lophiotrema nucula]
MAAVLPAEPILASSLIDDEELGSIVSRIFLETKKTERKDVVRTGVSSVDEALEGGLERGGMVGVSGEVGAGSNEMCTALLVSSLLQDTMTAAAVVDTAGNFDIVRVYTLILSRVQQDEELLQRLRAEEASGSESSVEDTAAKVLDRLKIMRVFDFVGVMEAVGEIRDGLEGRSKRKEATPAVENPTNAVGEVAEETSSNVNAPIVETHFMEAAAEERVIADSQEEEDEMLFDSEIATQTVRLPTQELPVREQQPLQPPNQHEPPSLKTSFILMDNLAQVLSPFLKKDYIQANNLLTALLRSLSHLTHTHSLITLLLNPATVPRPRSPTRKVSGPPQPQQVPTPPPSVFSDVKAIPALGNVLGVYVDVGLMVSRVPRRKVDARVLYSEGHNKKGVQWVEVVEVVSDRWGGRTGGWGTFLIDQEKCIKDL